MSLYVTQFARAPGGAHGKLDENLRRHELHACPEAGFTGAGARGDEPRPATPRTPGTFARVRERLTTLFAEGTTWTSRCATSPSGSLSTGNEAVGMFSAIFLFISLIMGVIVLFTVVNTMGTSVVERTSEIGTAPGAMGLRRGGVRRMFVLEGAMLGVLGATVGVALGQLVAILFNSTGSHLDASCLGRTGTAPGAHVARGWTDDRYLGGARRHRNPRGGCPRRTALLAWKVVDALRHV